MEWTLSEVEEVARARLSPAAYDYAAGGAGSEGTLRGNVEAFARWRLRPRVLVDVATRDLSTRLLGRRYPAPIGVAPTAFHRLFHPDGEAAVARAASRRGLLHVVSTLATTPLEEVAQAGAAAGDHARWFQLYVHRDRELTLDLVRRARAAGYEALVLTVDMPVEGIRHRDRRNRFTLPPGLAMGNFLRALDDASGARDGLSRYIARQFDASLTWEAVDWLRARSGMPVVVKGVTTAEDARAAVAHGAAGVVVSNHGGRVLDRAVATLDALPEVARAVDGAVPVLLDGGVRGGVDVLVALALGADFVLLGRSVVWGLAAGGEEGVGRVLDLVREELDNAMALAGRPRLADVDATLLAQAG